MTAATVPADVRCPVCERKLGERSGADVIQRIHRRGHGVRVVQSPASSTRISCDKPDCPGVWWGDRTW